MSHTFSGSCGRFNIGSLKSLLLLFRAWSPAFVPRPVARALAEAALTKGCPGPRFSTAQPWPKVQTEAVLWPKPHGPLHSATCNPLVTFLDTVDKIKLHTLLNSIIRDTLCNCKYNPNVLLHVIGDRKELGADASPLQMLSGRTAEDGRSPRRHVVVSGAKIFHEMVMSFHGCPSSSER